MWTERTALRAITRQKALNFKPGSEHLYSNSGYVLLSLAAQKVIGGKLDDWMRLHVWGPLEMTRSRWQHDHRDPVPMRAHGYVTGWKIADSMLDTVGDGGMYSSLDDMLRWAVNFDTRGLGGRLLDRMAAPGENANGYGMGLTNGTYFGLETIAHGGALAGYRTMLLRIPSKQFTAVCLCNAGDQNAPVLANTLADIWLEGELGEAKRFATEHINVAPIVLVDPISNPRSFVGDWRSEELDAVYRIREIDGKLMLDAGELKPFRFYNNGKNRVTARGIILELHSPTMLTLNAGRVRGIEFQRIGI